MKDGKLQADAVLELDGGHELPLFDPQKAVLHMKASSSQSPSPSQSLNPTSSPDQSQSPHPLL